jgi:hypothetical protein
MQEHTMGRDLVDSPPVAVILTIANSVKPYQGEADCPESSIQRIILDTPTFG